MEDWEYYGEWKQYMMFTEPWFYAFDKEVFTTLDRPLYPNIKCLDGYWFFYRKNIEILKEVFLAHLDKEGWFTDYFALFDRKITFLLTYGENRDFFGFLDALTDLMGCSSLLEHMDVAIQKVLPTIITERGANYEEFLLTLQAPRETHMMQYRRELHEGISDEELLEKHGWIGTHGFEGEGLTKEKIAEDRKQPYEVHELGQVAENLKNIQHICSKLLFYRSHSVETMDKIIYTYRAFLTELGEKHDLTYEEVISCTLKELKNLAQQGIVVKGLRKRKRTYGVVRIENTTTYLYGKDLAKELTKHPFIIEEVNTIKGRTGYKGKVVGKAKILQTADDIQKVQEGDILVANETTPQYIPAMRKAAAFVTDIGGITSHAAIMSREMKKPCIIGTKTGTRVFKDGDTLEVDADKGIATKINQKE